VVEKYNVLKLFMISHILWRNMLGTIQKKCVSFRFIPSALLIILLSVASKVALTSDDPQTATGMQIVFGVSTEVSQLISDVGIIRIPTAYTHC
jgi:hypothetical protein